VPLAIFGITDSGLNLAVNLVILVLVVLWLALAYWTFADARRRIADPVLVTTATVLGFVPFLGPLVYTILRPPEFLEDVREREIETQASELRMRHLTAQSCPRCEHPIERSWLRCPECQHRLKDPCISCNRPVDPRWSICPYCETQLRRQSSRDEESPKRSRSRSRSEEEAGDREATSASTPPPKRRASSSRSSSSTKSKSSSSTGSSDRKPRSKAPEADADSDGEGTRPRRRSTTTS
jgi:double zinc ribbon protein